MAIALAKLLISAMAVFMLVSASFATSEVPFMVVHKKATLNRLKSGAERVTVSFDIYNQGSSSAYDVTLTDNSWVKAKFDVVNGNTSKSWERLDAGGILSHSFELEAKVKGVFYGAPAVVTFRIPTKPALQEAYSTPLLPLDILADKPPTNMLDVGKRILAKYGSLVSVISMVVLFIYLVATPKSNVSKSSSKKKR
ncbi:PREDICTED: translocon-associated protein subunit beta [Camelina sativa]|uniref:Translocon-associated protein subunit beta n=1 Tax=Camelina sativa TaxID=90675 RepID=A0ABM0T2P9_CAMSA|nr:PREDICTED: translocon-associated protein subunit beta [Camelina sativa]XP_010453510.1 PREDICTED: translocon-associated protein subunit beta [Camelina sativa]